MFADQFTGDSPGELVSTEFEVRSLRDGRIEVEVVRGHAFVPAALPPALTMGEVTEATFDHLIEAERSLARLDEGSADLPNARLLWAPLARREAIMSSRIEDTIATAVELASVEAGEPAAREEVKEVENYVAALHYGLEHDLPICNRLIRGMHERLLSRGVRGHDQQPGRIRTTQNFIGNHEGGFAMARFVPPPPQYLEEGLRQFDHYANRKKYGIPKVAAIAIMHYQFEALHPFADGNGRIGRLVSALSLCRMGLLKQPLVYLSGFFEPRRDLYNDHLLRVSTHGEWIDWIRFFTEALACQSQDAEARVRELRILRQSYREAMASQNAPSRINGLIDSLFAHPVVTAERAAALLDVSKPTARSYIDRLVGMNALEEIPRSYRKLWFAPQIIRLIDAPQT